MKIIKLKQIVQTNDLIYREIGSNNIVVHTVWGYVIVDSRVFQVTATPPCNFTLNICSKLREFIKTNPDEFRDILVNNDTIENPISIYRYGVNGQIIEKTTCEQFGYPYNDVDGYLQSKETHFETEEEALDFAIVNLQSNIISEKNEINFLIQKIVETYNRKESNQKILSHFQEKKIKT
jgi:hypothetical protein